MIRKALFSRYFLLMGFAFTGEPYPGDARAAIDDSPETEKTRDSAKSRKAEGTARRTPPIFYLRDGGKVAGRPSLEMLQIRTRYGTLRVPVSEIIQVLFARRIDPEVKEEIARAIRRMGSDDFDVREDAMEDLRGIGPDALGQLRDATKSKNEEIKVRAQVLVEEFQEKSDDEDPVVSSDIDPVEGDRDQVVTRKFTIRGRVVEDEFAVRSRYGVLRLDAADIVGIFFDRGGHVSESVDVEGSKIVPANWVKTAADLTKGQHLEIEAKGQLHVSNYNLTVGPEGTRRYSGSTFQNFPMLSLVGKVGKKGKPFVVGRSYKGKVGRDGTLYLGVVPFRRNYRATGTYKVEVEAEPGRP